MYTTKEEIINALIGKYGYKSYLEIGYQHGNSFRQINCKRKQSVDPAPTDPTEEVFIGTSDEYFAQLDGRKKYDLIFIDGSHIAADVALDLYYAHKHLKKNGAIVMHDCIPPNKESQIVPRQTKHWTGDGWRVFVAYREKYPEVVSLCHDCDYGVGVIFPAGLKIEEDLMSAMTYEDFVKDRNNLLGVVKND